MKPFSESCEQNQQVILDIIKPLLHDCHSVLEIGSGTGQHAVYFAQHLPHVQWQSSDRQENIKGIQLWLDEADLSNISSPLVLNVMQAEWPELSVDAVFMANTLHIMSWHEVKAFFSQISRVLQKNASLIIYGPFNYHGQYTSESNQRFDLWLKSRDPDSGIRDFSAVNRLAEENQLQLVADYAMPANNRILYWKNSNLAKGF